MASPLEHYGLIGDSITVALVSRTGSLDWLCLPRIDSDACFARLLGTDDHGYWTIRPAAEVRGIAPRYRADTLILEPEVTCDAGLVRVIANDPRMLTTIAAIEKGLTSDGFVYRYATETGVDGLAIRHDPGLL